MVQDDIFRNERDPETTPEQARGDIVQDDRGGQDDIVQGGRRFGMTWFPNNKGWVQDDTAYCHPEPVSGSDWLG